MENPEIRTELSLIRRDVDDIKLFIPEIRNALQQLAVTNAQLVANMDEHKIIWQHVNGLKEKCEDQVIPHITVWAGHRGEHDHLDAIIGKLMTEHAVCMAEKIPKAKKDTMLDKILPQLIVAAIVATVTIFTVIVLLHAANIIKIWG